MAAQSFYGSVKVANQMRCRRTLVALVALHMRVPVANLSHMRRISGAFTAQSP